MGLDTTEKDMQIEKELQNIQDNLRRIHAAYDDKGEDLSAWPLKAADAIELLGIALRKNEQEGWKEAAIAWEVCASIHNKWAKGKDALYSTRHADFVKHADDARQKLTHNVQGEGREAALSRSVPSTAGLAIAVEPTGRFGFSFLGRPETGIVYEFETITITRNEILLTFQDTDIPTVVFNPDDIFNISVGDVLGSRSNRRDKSGVLATSNEK